MSFGTFGTGLSTQYRYGIAMSTKPKGVIMDIDRILKQTVDKDNKAEKVTAYNRATGPSMSLNENLIPEQLFDDPKTTEKEAQGISAVKALQIAAQQGQTIYTVTKANYAEILPKLNHSTDVMTDVRNAINAGKEVTISQTQVHAFGWSGTGYIVLDPESGVGGYLIGGGADGGWSETDSVNLLTTLALAFHDVLNIAPEYTWYISETLERMNFIRNIANWLGAAAFGVSTYYTVTDESLNINSKIGRILSSFLAGVAIAYIGAALVGTGLIGLVIVAAIAVTLAYLTLIINTVYFSARVIRKNEDEAYYV